MIPSIGTLLFLLPAGGLAADIEQVQGVVENKLSEAEKSQERVDRIVEGAQERLIQYRSLLKQIEGLKAYNTQLRTQIASQEELMGIFDQSILQISLIERQMWPLVSKMADSLDRFTKLDLPFYTVERRDRMAFIQDNLVAADVDIAEKFRQVLEAYQIENEYGRKIDSFQALVTLNGIEQEVEVLRIGRIAMVCQTRDTKLSARWDNESKTWKLLDNATYRNAIRYGIKMAKKQAPIDLLTLPITVPEAL